MTSEGLGEMFEGDSAETSAGKFSLVSMEDKAEGLKKFILILCNPLHIKYILW